MEIWKDIPCYRGLYEASDKGNIRSKEGKTTSSARCKKRTWKQRIIKQKYRKTKHGRCDAMVILWKDKKPHSHLVSRLIATTFIKNLLYSDYTVNHKDGNPLNNSADNLEWLSRADNIKYGFKNNQYRHIMKPISATNANDYTIFAESYADMDRQLNQYHGYTSRVVSQNKTTLFSKSGDKFSIDPY